MLGVGAAALRATGALGAPELVSSFALDDGNAIDAKNGVNGAVHGIWTSTSTPSLVSGVPGTSFFKNGGTAHIILPADNLLHGLVDLTVTFYFQPSASTNKHILLAAGDGTQEGDFSIERLTNGQLRGYHVGQDGVLRFFESTTGIPSTNLVVGTAYRITLTLGPGGAKLYLDDDLVSSIQESTNGWNNSRDKYIGIWIDGTLSPAEGVFDYVRLWNRRLSDDEIVNELPAARSITLPGTQEQLSVPSLAEWLVSDEIDPTPTKFVSNQNRGNGSGSSPANAQEVQAALNGASPGQTFLAVCQTPGTIEFWNYPNGLTFPSGSPGNYITLQAREGDGVVISAAEDFSAARTPNSGVWTQSGLSQADIDKKIWRSASRMGSVGESSRLYGFWVEFDIPHMLLAYNNLTDLRAAYGTSDTPTNYGTAGAYMDDGFVYIRMQRPHPGKYSTDDKWSAQTYPGHPEAVSSGRIIIPINEDPNAYVVHLFRRANPTAFNASQWIKVGAGINSLGFRHALTGSHIWCDRGLHLTWRNFISTAANGSLREDYFCHRTRCSSGSKIHASRGEWKFGGWLEGDRDAAFNMFNSNTMSDIHCKDCTIGHYHEMMTGAGGAARFRWRNCTFVSILDDGIQAQHTMSRVEMGYCFFYNSAFGGMGTSGSEGDDANPGGWFIHHNVLDYRQERGTNWRAQPHPGFIYISHSPDGRSPRKFYNNLFIFGPDHEEETTLGFSHCDGGSLQANTLTGASLMHETFNNIFLRVFLEGTKRYDAISSLGGRYSDNLQNRSDFAIGRFVRYSADHSNELFDYNLYWRSSGMNVNGLLRGYSRNQGINQADYATLADWKASSEFGHSKLSGTYRGAYSSGFDGNSTESKPTLPSLDNYPTDRFKYRPSATSAVTTAASGSLGGANWWSTPPSWGATYFPWNDGEKTLAPNAWKGPLDPNGSTLPVGVQNP